MQTTALRRRFEKARTAERNARYAVAIYSRKAPKKTGIGWLGRYLDWQMKLAQLREEHHNAAEELQRAGNNYYSSLS